MTLIATLAEFKAHLNYTGDSSNDTELTMHLQAASDWVVETIRGPLTVTSFTDLVEMHRGRIFMRNRPLVSVTSVTSEFSGATLDSSTYVVDTTRCMVRMMWWSGYGTGWYTVVYTAGLASIPDKVKLAGLIVARHLWETQNGGGGLPFPGDNDLVPSGLGFAVPRRAVELLERNTIPRVN